MDDMQAWLSVKLAELADDFDRLSDPARDDANFIYEWAPPAWLIGGKMVQGREAQESAVGIASMLREAVKVMESL